MVLVRRRVVGQVATTGDHADFPQGQRVVVRWILGFSIVGRGGVGLHVFLEGLLGVHGSGEPDEQRRQASGARGGSQAAIFAFSPWSSASRNCSVVCQGWSGPIRSARSLVIWPPSTVSMQTFSRVAAKASTSGVPSSLPR